MDRIAQTTTPVTPTPGALLVDFDSLLGQDRLPFDRTKLGTTVSATVTVRSIAMMAGGHARGDDPWQPPADRHAAHDRHLRRTAGERLMAAVARTSNFHFARMRCAEDMARSLSVRHTTLTVFSGLSVATRGEADQVAAARDSYYLLAAAHRAAGRRIERRVRRALAWSDFKANPFAETYWKAGDVARLVSRKASRLARTIRRVVNV